MTGLRLAGPGEPLHHVDQQLGQPFGQVGLGEEGAGVTVIDGPAPGEHFAQIGGEDGSVELPLADVRVRDGHLTPRFQDASCSVSFQPLDCQVRSCGSSEPPHLSLVETLGGREEPSDGL